MLAHLSALEVLQLCLTVAFIAACFGWLGGVGGTLTLRLDISRVKAVLGSMVASVKGTNGQAAVREQRERLSKADKEAAELAAQLQASARHRGPPRALRSAPPSGVFEEEQAIEQLEERAKAMGLKPKGGDA